MATIYEQGTEVLHVRSNPADMRKFKKMLSPHKLAAGSKEEADAGSRLLSLLQASGLSTVIVEKDYKDVDYTSSFSRFHFRRHHEGKRRCERLHFLAIEIKPKDVDLLLFGPRKLFSRLNEPEAYLGFLVIRPLSRFHLGRCVLSSHLVRFATAETSFITCKTKYSVNLVGGAIAFVGVPWIQQDGGASACASAAIWVVSEYMSNKFCAAFRRYTTAEITDLASQYPSRVGRPMPSQGLTTEQMLLGLDRMGYEAVGFDFKNAAEARRKIYYYVESGIPVILSLGSGPYETGHAITVVGHTLDETLTPQLDERLDVCPISRTSDFVPSFIAQDDDRGPFVTVKLLTFDQASADESLKELMPKRQDGSDTLAVLMSHGTVIDIFYLLLVTVPFPAGVSLAGDAAEDNVAFFLQNFNKSGKLSKQNPVVLRTFLQLSNDVKSDWGYEGSRPREVGKMIRSHLFSRWVWVTEISSLNMLRKTKMIFGQVIQDCAGHSTEVDLRDFLIWHLPGVAGLSFPTGKPLVKRISTYNPYKRRQ